MMQLRASEHSLAETISEQLNAASVGLIYLDVARITELEETNGRLHCEQVLTAMKLVLTDLLAGEPEHLATRSVGDDFFLYMRFEGFHAEYASNKLHEWGGRLKYQVERRLAALIPSEPPVELHVGGALLVNSLDKDIDTILYTAMKMAIREAKQLTNSKERKVQLDEFNRIVENQLIRSVYQPIVSLTDAAIFGYEALSRGPADSVFASPLPLFEFAESEGALYVLDKLAREKAIQGCIALHRNQKVFINIPAYIIHDPQFTPGQTMKLLSEYGLLPQNVVFELTERSSIEDFATTKRILQHYRAQGYQIAIDDAGAGYSSLQAIAELQPDYIKVDRSLIQDIHKDKIKEHILETFVTFAHKMNIRIIAEGIEQSDELLKLMRMGVHFAQGYYIGRPADQLKELAPEVRDMILLHSGSKQLSGSAWSIGELTTPVESFSPSATAAMVANHFKKHQDESGTVIVDPEGVPVGLMMRDRLFQMLAGQYGVSLFWNKPIGTLMDAQPLVVDEQLPVEQVSQMAMAREYSQLYDIVIVTRNNHLLGIASIRTILEAITQLRLESARVANPLTGLPGNLQIQLELNRRILENRPFSVIYIDLDYFKWYNDRYGFQKGDKLIQFTADVMQRAVRKFGEPHDFIGHIGGDDLIIVTTTARPNELCEQLIELFENGVTMFYDADEWTFVEDREGRRMESRGVSISVALIQCDCSIGITAEQISQEAAIVKKRAKAIQGSVHCSGAVSGCQDGSQNAIQIG